MRFLIIQTAFIGDVILASGLPGKIRSFYPDAHIDFLVRKGNESLLENNPDIEQVLIWDKKQGKYQNLFKLIRTVRKNKYSHVINLQRFAAMGFLTARSKAKHKIGFKKNPFSFWFNEKVEHTVGNNQHEVDRNNALIESFTDESRPLPRLFPSIINFENVKQYQNDPYMVVAPASVWFTKQTPVDKWVDLCKANQDLLVYFIGAPGDADLAQSIIDESGHKNAINLCGLLSLLDSAALIKGASMTFSNDSAPMHIASAVNAPITAVYCSTIPGFGFGPLSDSSRIIETEEKLDCKPCGLHGYKACPKGHFKCGKTLDLNIQLNHV